MWNGVHANESAPDSIESGRPSISPPPESCSLPPYAPILSGGMAPTGRWPGHYLFHHLFRICTERQRIACEKGGEGRG